MALLPTSGAFEIPFSQRINGDFLGDAIPFFNKTDHLFRFMEDKTKKATAQYREALIKETHHYKTTISDFKNQQESGIYFAHLNLEKGFEDKKGKTLFITELDIFNKKKKKPARFITKMQSVSAPFSSWKLGILWFTHPTVLASISASTP